jgi:Fe2+ transport system protein FeoA
MKRLSELSIGETATIVAVRDDEAIKERLHSFGLIRGVEIVPVRVSPLGCPRIYRCMDTEIAIRNRTASNIEIEIL